MNGEIGLLDGFTLEDDVAIATWLAETSGPGIVFVKTYAHGERLATFCDCPFVTGKDSAQVRRRYVEDLGKGKLPWIVATSAMATGVDIPPLRYVALAGVNGAPIGVIQAAGRALRPDGSKEFEIRVFSPGEGVRTTERIVTNLDRAGYPVTLPLELPQREVTRGGFGGQEPTSLRDLWEEFKPFFRLGIPISLIVSLLLLLTGNCSN